MTNLAYAALRPDLINFCPKGRQWGSILDVGCAHGANAAYMRDHGSAGARTVGIELVPELGEVARENLDEVLITDAVQGLSELCDRGETFDLVFCGDVLEHLLDPWEALSMVRQLCPTGYVVVSLPNVAHYSTFVALLKGHWPYKEVGIHDRTHLRWFAHKNIAQLFEQAGLKEVKRHTYHRLIKRPDRLNQAKVVQSLLARTPGVRRLTTYQYLSLLQAK